MRKKQRNIEWLKDLAAILMFLFLFPYFAFSFKEQKEEWSKNQEGKEVASDEQILEMYENFDAFPHNEHYYTVWEEEGVTLRLPAEHFMVGALAASIPADYEKEVMKAQAIILRSTLMQEYENQREDKAKQDISHVRQEISLNKEKWSYWTDRNMQSRWGAEYEDNLKKYLSAVTETQGVYLKYNGKPIDGCYTGMSAGGTRSASDLSKEDKYGYLRQTTCPENLSAADYTGEYRIQKEDVGELSDVEKSEEGYVLSLMRGKERISGEELREQLGLASSNFTWEEDGETYIFRTKGKGHGFGLDQYYGNVLAQKGKDYREIIEYFFAEVTYQRME